MRGTPKPPTLLHWTTEQRDVHALLVDRHHYGIAIEIAEALGLKREHVFRFKAGMQQFPAQKLAELRAFLERAPAAGSQAALRELLAECVSRGLVHGAHVAHEFGVHKSTVSRFRKGEGTFPKDRADELEAFLRELVTLAKKSPPSTATAKPSSEAPSRVSSRKRRAPRQRRSAAPAPLPRSDVEGELAQMVLKHGLKDVESALTSIRAAVRALG